MHYYSHCDIHVGCIIGGQNVSYSWAALLSLLGTPSRRSGGGRWNAALTLPSSRLGLGERVDVLTSARRAVFLPQYPAAPIRSILLDTSLAVRLNGRLAQSTHGAYASQQREFAAFCTRAGLPPPGTAAQLAEHLACWVMGWSENGFKFSTIELGIYAVLAEAARLHGWQSISQSVALKDALAVARRQRGAGKSPKLLITPELLARMVAALQREGGWLPLRDACFFVISWFGMLRDAEALTLCWGDVRPLAEGLERLIRRSKTDQPGEGAFLLIGGLAGCAVDPAAIFRAWQAANGRALAGPVFPRWDGTQAAAKDTMLNRLRRALTRVGLTPGQAQLFELHSLRRGAPQPPPAAARPCA